MKAEVNKIADRTDIDESINNLAEVVNGNIGSDNIKYEKLSDTTHGTANTKKLFYHRLKAVPKLWLPVKGRVYVKQLTAELVDVRSPATSESFEILLVR